MPFAIILFSLLPKIGYLIGVVAIYSGAGPLKWWIVGLGIMTWWSRGAITMANQAMAVGDITQKQVTRTIISHWVFMIGLYATSIVSLAKY